MSNKARLLWSVVAGVIIYVGFRAFLWFMNFALSG